MGVSLVTAPTVEPVTLSEARGQVSVVTADIDAQLAAWVTASRLTVERHSGLKLITQTWDCASDAFPTCRDAIVLPLAPLQSVTSVTWYDDAEVPTVVDPTTYVVDRISSRPRIALRQGKSWPTGVLRAVNGVVVRAVFGFGPAPADVAKVAEPLRTAMLLLIGHLEAHPDAVNIGNVVTQLPLGFEMLVRTCRRELLA
jgi:uncharacterized phiE125 gp8 family phage protein